MLEINIPINCESKEAAQEKEGYNVWNYTINRITFKRGKEIDEQLSRAE